MRKDALLSKLETRTFIGQCRTTQQTQSSQAARIIRSQQIKLKYYRTDRLRFGAVCMK